MRYVKGLCSLVVCAQLGGCFIFIPGGLIAKVSDGITGDTGAHCVSTTVKVGDKINMGYGGTGVVKSLSGRSMRCNSEDKPIRALIE